MEDTTVEVKLTDGRTVRGRLAGADDKTATIVSTDGTVVPVALVDATEIREVAPVAPPKPVTPPLPPPTLDPRDADRVDALAQRYGAGYDKPKGEKMHTAGSVLVALGVTQMIVSGGLGIAWLALDDGTALFAPGIGLLIGGLATVAVGGPLMRKGKERRQTYYAWLHQQSLQSRFTPAPLMLRGGGGVSFRLAF